MLKAAVIGVGAMGRHHARIYHEMRDVELVAVSDIAEDRRRETERLYNVDAYVNYGHMLDAVDIDMVTIAVPTELHCQATLDALGAGCHVLVEKPIALTLGQAELMIARAGALEQVLAVGHIERYNSAIVELRGLLDGEVLGRIFQIHTRRLGPFPERVHDVGVVVDLATHDLDIMCYLIRDAVSRVYGETSQNMHSAHEDLFSGLVVFENGILGVLDVNWLTPTKIREVTVTGERGMLFANLLTQDLYYYENELASTSNWDNISLLRGVREGRMTRLHLCKVEPLRKELEAFVAAVRGERADIVCGEDGLYALRLARALLESGRNRRVIVL